MYTARNVLAGAGTQPAALAFGGDASRFFSSNRRIYNNRNKNIKTVTVS
jgi:hypothetical protein